MDFPLRNALVALAAMAALGLVPTLSRADEEQAAPDKQQYIRRLMLDVEGRTPTEQEVRTFVEDRSPDSYKRLVKRLGVVPGDTTNAERLDKEAAEAHLEWARQLGMTYRGAVQKKVSAAYLGIGVDTPSATIRAQLKLPEGAGLVVNFVDPEGPSKGVVQEHDVIEKLDEQILVNGEQLVALVRMHRQGETVTLTLIREAKRVAVPVKLGEKQVEALGSVPNMSAIYADNAAMAGNLITTLDPKLKTSIIMLDANGTINLAAGNLGGNVAWAKGLEGAAAGEQPLVVSQQAGPLTFDDGKTLVLYYLSPAGKPQTITVLDRASGKLMFSGPAGTEEQWKAVPEDVRQKIAAWRDMLKQVNGTPDPATPPAQK